MWGSERALAGVGEGNQTMKHQNNFFFFLNQQVEKGALRGSTSVERRILGSAVDHKPNTTGLCHAVVVKQV